MFKSICDRIQKKLNLKEKKIRIEYYFLKLKRRRTEFLSQDSILQHELSIKSQNQSLY